MGYLANEVIPRDLLVGEGDVPLRGSCGYCHRMVDSTNPSHRVSAILMGGRGVECVLRGDLPAHLAGPLAP